MRLATRSQEQLNNQGQPRNSAQKLEETKQAPKADKKKSTSFFGKIWDKLKPDEKDKEKEKLKKENQ
jgi:hypothetical protein